MSKETRMNEILSQITAFGKETCTKTEYLPELLKLQQEMVCLTFNNDHAENADLRLWNVVEHFTELNEERGHIADEELEKFKQDCKKICNTIIAEISGNSGEQKVFQALNTLRCHNRVMTNVELCFDDSRTEIDLLVFTNKAIFIIEVKNTKKNIFIDEDGEFYRCGDSLNHDCNIAQKMDERERLLRLALDNTGLEQIKIIKVVVFTSPYHLDVENKCHRIKVSFAKSLPFFIEKFKGGYLYDEEDICTMLEAVDEAKCKEQYRMPIDMNEYKVDFARLMTKLEMPNEVMGQFKESLDLQSENNADIFACEDLAVDTAIKPMIKANDKSEILKLSRRISTAAACFCIFNTVLSICRSANWR